ncbi:hypothetical protein [Roseomonas sp. USHLN139]|uniref:hypothetical protein n=1 Tax=Roseomonas sp. USHLN139 TaxID=3081298 RepID=UPI003B025CD6
MDLAYRVALKDDASAAAEKITGAMGKVAKASDNAAAAADKTTSAVAKMAKANDNAGAAAEKTARSVGKATKATDDASASAEKAAAAAGKMAKANDNASAAADGLAQSNTKAGDVILDGAEKVRRAIPTWEQLSRRYDDNARAAAARAKADRDLARAAQVAADEVAKGLKSQQQADQLLTQVKQRTDAYVASIERQIAAEKRRQAAVGGPVSGGVANDNKLTVQARSLSEFSEASDKAADRAKRFGMIAGQAGFQVQDFAVQVASGQSALVAFAQQAPQFLGVFGTGGAIAGAVVAIAAIGIGFLRGADAAKVLSDTVEKQENLFEGATRAAERWRQGLAEEAEQVNLLRARYVALDQERRASEVRRLEAVRAELAEQAKVLRESASSTTNRLDRVFENMRSGNGRNPLPAQADQVTEALKAFRDNPNTSRAVLELANALSAVKTSLAEGGGQAGFFTEALTRAIKELDQAVPSADKLQEAVRQNAVQLAAAKGEALPAADGIRGVGEASAGAAGQVGTVTSAAAAAAAALRTLRAQTADNPYSGLDRQTADLKAQIAALERGGRDALELTQRHQQRRQAAADERETMLNDEATAIRDLAREEAARASSAEAGAAILARAEQDVASAREVSIRRIAQEQGEVTRLTERRDALVKKLEEQEKAARGAAAAQRELNDRANDTDADGNDFERSGRVTRALQRLREQRERDNKREEDAAKRRADQQERVEKRQADRLDRMAERYGDSMASETISAFEQSAEAGRGIFGGLSRFLGSMMRQAAQAALSNLVFQPVIRAVVGGAAGGSAAASPGSAGGGGLSSLASLSGIRNLFSMGGGSISSALDSWGAANLGGLGFSGPATAAGAGTLGHTSADALLASLPAGPTPTLTPGLIGGGDLLGGFSSFSNVLGIAGSVLPGLMSGNYGQAAAGGIGAGLGTIIMPGLGTAIGGMLGNLVGGLFGGQKQHKAASVQYGTNADGQLVVTGSKSKWMDDKEAVAQTTQALQALNAKIAALGLTLDSATAGQTHFGEDSQPEEDSRNMTLAVLEGMRGGTDNMTRVITAELSKAYGGDADLDRAIGNVEWVKNIYDPLVGANQAGSALQQQLDALSTSFGATIAKAEELGLATDVLRAKQAEAIEATKNAFRMTYDAAVRELDGRTYVDQVTAVRSFYTANADSFREAGRDPEQLYDRQMRAVLNTFSDAQLRDIATAFVGIDDAAVTLAKQLLETGSAAQKAANQAVATGYWQTSRQAEGRGYINSVEGVRTFYEQNRAAFEAAGVDGVRLFHQQMTAVLDQLNVDQLRDVAVSFRGLDDAAADAAEQMLRLGNSTTKAAAAAELAARQQAGGSIRGYVDSMRASAAGGFTPAEQLKAAQDQFGRDLALARGGNAEASGRITGTADTLMKALDQMYGSTAAGRQGRDWVLSQLEQLPATQSYDALILAELQKLGGRIDVSVELTTFRVITEQLQALSEGDRGKLVQAETVLRTVEDRLGRVLSTAERSRLIEGAVVLRSIEQSLGRNLTAAERASLVSSGDVLRAIEQRIGRQLTAAEAAGLVQSGTITRQVQELLGRGLTAAEAASLTAGGAVLRSVQEALGRSLTAAETASLVQGETVRRLVEQTMGRSLTAAERDGLVQAAAVIRSVEQSIGRNLTEAERGTLLASLTVTRTVDQVIGRTLTAAELASFQASQTVLRRVEETLGRTLTTAERAALMQSTSIDRVVRETLGRTLTAAEDATLAKAGAVVRTVEQRLGRALTEAERASLVATATVTRTVQQAMGRSLTAAERAGLVASEDVLRRVEQTLGRNLTAAEKAELVAGGTVARAVEQRLGATLTAAERASLVQGGSVLRSVEQALGRQLTAAETAALIPAGTVDRTVMQQVRALTASQLTQLVNSEAVVRTVEQQLGRTLTAAERAQLLEAATLRRTVEEGLGRTLTAAEKASLAQATTVIRSVEERLGRTLTAAEDASLVDAGTVVRQIQQQLGRDLTAAERASLVATATVERDIAQRLARDLTQTERAGLVASEDVLRRVEQSLGRTLTAAEKAELVAGGTVARAVEQRLGATLTAAEQASLVQGGSVLRSIEQAIGRQLTAAETAALIPAGTVDRTVVQMVQTLTSTQRAKLVGGETVTRQIEQALGRTLTAAERASLIDSATVRREVTEVLGARLTAAERASLAQGGTILQSIEQQLGRQLTAAERQTILNSGTVTRTVDQKVETTETVLISRSIDDKIGASLKAQTDLLSAMKGSTATQAQTLAVLDGRLRNIDLWTYGLRELARGQWGGIRVTTPKASGAANDPANFNTTIGNWGTTLTVNALGNAFAGGRVIPFARGGVPMVDDPTFFPMTGGNLGLLGEAGPEAILPLARMGNGDLGVQADLAMPVLPPMPAPTGDDAAAILAALQQMAEQLQAAQREIAALRAERREDARAAQKTAERTADAAEDTADSNRRMARKREPLMQRGGTK